MEANQILRADVLDIVFEGRNKIYGAYELRKSYNKRLKTALTVMIGGCLFAFLAAVAAQNNNQQQPFLTTNGDVILQNAEPSQPTVPPPPPMPPPPTPPIATIKFTTPVLTETVEIPPPVQDTMDNIAIGKIDNKDGIISDIVAPPVENRGVTTASPKVIEKYDTEFKTVQIQARFPGGAAAWIRFLERTLWGNIPTDNGAPAGTYSIVVSFLVDREGNVSEAQALSDAGYGTAAEAIRAIENGPKWIPAIQNGRNVIYRQKQTITFRVEEEQ